MKTKAKQRRRWVKSLYAIVAVIAMFPFLHAHAWDWEWTSTWGEAEATCGECGETYTIYADNSSEAEEAAADLFCDNCGSCSLDVNEDCYQAHHCIGCSSCIDNDEYHEGYYDTYGDKICYDCWEDIADGQDFACQHCLEMFGAGVVACDCEWSFFTPHCTDCTESECSECGACLVVSGNETAFLDEGGCQEHELCIVCLRDKAGADGEHCRECYMCDGDICSECALCEPCAEGEEHCPDCQTCFGGNDIEWCKNEGYHCVNCCDENDWLCENCGKCIEGSGVDLCDDCGICEQCCRENSEAAGCDHGYCIESSDYDDHLCPECQQCTTDDLCGDCERCESCQADYHCEHELCPESSEWDDHLCPDCGDCFEEDELCEYCGLCESCREHCDDHDFCSENDGDGDHFVCDQCGDCYEDNRCEYCELCEDCCRDKISEMDCSHDFCVESDDFADHWCYTDDQCLEDCDHVADCKHTNVSTTWSTNGSAHWHLCPDCGITIDKAIHTEGDPVTLTAPDAANRKNGTAQVNCKVCDHKMGTISIPYVAPPTDGKPYIISQPDDYTGKTNTSAYIDGGERWATFKVKAGGENLTYQWYRQYGDRVAVPVEEDPYNSPEYYDGTKTATLKILVGTDACSEDEWNRIKHYCVVSNANGSVTTNTVHIRAQHVWGNYYKKDAETHENYCFGECSAVKNVSKHRLSAWELVRPATSTATGLRQQKCMDCGYKNEEVIPKVAPNHVHKYDVAKHDPTQHWFVCSCGLESTAPKADHNFDKTEVITPATEKKMGENKVTCTACGFSKTVKTDKLPHTHDWYTFDSSMFIWGPDHRLIPDPKKGGRGLESHHVKCKGCNEKKAESHTWPMWECTKAPKSADERGKLVRYCEDCGYEQIQYYPLGTWPIMIEGGTAYKLVGRFYQEVAFAQKGTSIKIVFNPKAAKKMTHQDKPVKFKRWYDGTDYTGETSMPWDGGKTSIDLPRIRFGKPEAETNFRMPDGPAVIFAGTEECKHTGETKQGERVEATCASHGHEPHTFCKDCDEMLVEGARIPALGHDLPPTPIAGTAKVEYCYVDGKPNTARNGWSGNFKCNRCNEIVKGGKTPLRHGNRYANGNVKEDWYYLKATDATCTKKGYGGDEYCKWCDKFVRQTDWESAWGHNWGDWTVVREATTKIKGMEQHSCTNDGCSKVETRVTDYSGPDYTLKADKTKLHFEWVYGDPVPSQTITFKSVGRNDIQNPTYAIEVNDLVDVSFEGLTFTVTPKDIVEDQEHVVSFDLIARNENGETIYITSPEMYMTCRVKKTAEKYALTVEDGVATTCTRVGATSVPDGNWSNNLQVRGGVIIRLEPDDEWRGDFVRWEVVEDASNLLRDRIERNNWWGWPSSPSYGNFGTFMSPNNVTVRAVYKQYDANISYGVTELSGKCGEDFTAPRLNNPNWLKVTYSGSNDNVVDVDPKTGKVTCIGPGTATITANFPGNAHYHPATASYVIRVTGTPTGIVNRESTTGDDNWYTIDGKKLNSEPTKKGIYVRNGKKVAK